MLPRLLIAILLAICTTVYAERQCLCKSKDRRRIHPVHPTHLVALASVSYSTETNHSEEEVVGPRDQAEFKKLLGNATWRLLHTMAARYPDEPTETEKKRTAQFIELLGYLYPCKQCAGHMRVMMAENPPKLNSQNDFSQWLCSIHNIVNTKLGKPEFPCEDVDSHYDCGCELDDDDDDEAVPLGHDALVKPMLP